MFQHNKTYIFGNKKESWAPPLIVYSNKGIGQKDKKVEKNWLLSLYTSKTVHLSMSMSASSYRMLYQINLMDHPLILSPPGLIWYQRHTFQSALISSLPVDNNASSTKPISKGPNISYVIYFIPPASVPCGCVSSKVFFLFISRNIFSRFRYIYGTRRHGPLGAPVYIREAHSKG